MVADALVPFVARQDYIEEFPREKVHILFSIILLLFNTALSQNNFADININLSRHLFTSL